VSIEKYKDPPPLVRPLGDRYVLFGLPPGDYPGVVRGEELADLGQQVKAAGDETFLADLGIKS